MARYGRDMDRGRGPRYGADYGFGPRRPARPPRYDRDYEIPRGRAPFRRPGGYGPELSGWSDRQGGYEQRGNRVVRRQTRMSDADRVRASEVMTADPETVTADTAVADVARLMRDLDVGVIPVVDSEENGELQGVVTDRDLVVRVLADGKASRTRVSSCMSSDVVTVRETDSVHDVLDAMKRERVRRIPVTDGQGRLVGIISQADLAVNYAGLDLQRETEVEEAIERISEPARPTRGR